jgi:hypothetical protein
VILPQLHPRRKEEISGFFRNPEIHS